MRKRKRAALKLKAAKKAASVMAESNEVSEKQKLKVRSLYYAVLKLPALVLSEWRAESRTWNCV
jgi:hypothetical protein